MLKIPEQKGRKSNIDENIEASYKEIADTVNQAKLPKKQSDDNILAELDQFSGPEKPKEQPKVKEPVVKEENVEQPTTAPRRYRTGTKQCSTLHFFRLERRPCDRLRCSVFSRS